MRPQSQAYSVQSSWKHLEDSAAPHGRRHCSPSATTRAAGAVTAPGATTRQRRAGTLLPAAGGALGTPRRQRAPASPSPSLPSFTPRPPSCSTPPPASPSSSPSPSSLRPLAAGSPLPSLPSSPWLSSPALLSPASFAREPRPPASPSRLAAVGEPARPPTRSDAPGAPPAQQGHTQTQRVLAACQWPPQRLRRRAASAPWITPSHASDRLRPEQAPVRRLVRRMIMYLHQRPAPIFYLRLDTIRCYNTSVRSD